VAVRADIGFLGVAEDAFEEAEPRAVLAGRRPPV